MITSELDTIWITSDGKRFVAEDEALRHEARTISGTMKIEHRLRRGNTGRPKGTKTP